MPQYSPIAPVHMLQELQDKNLLGNYLLLLAHDVVAHPRKYNDLLFEVRDHYEPDNVFVIMDNGVVERGAPVPLEELLDAASIVDASCVVLPDVIGDFSATRRLVTSQLCPIANDYPIMCIPQGKNLQEVYDCIDWMAEFLAQNMFKDTYWGIPRWISNKLRSRRSVVNYINMAYGNKIHLLGMSEHMGDDFKCLGMKNVMGIDSANPLVLGMNDILMYNTMMYEHLPRDNYWQMPKMKEQMVMNVAWMHDAVSGT